MAKSRLIGDYPVIGIRPTIDGRRGPLKVRESLEVQTMNMAKNAAKLIEAYNSFFVFTTPSKLPKPSMCAFPIFVISPKSG